MSMLAWCLFTYKVMKRGMFGGFNLPLNYKAFFHKTHPQYFLYQKSSCFLCFFFSSSVSLMSLLSGLQTIKHQDLETVCSFLFYLLLETSKNFQNKSEIITIYVKTNKPITDRYFLNFTVIMPSFPNWNCALWYLCPHIHFNSHCTFWIFGFGWFDLPYLTHNIQNYTYQLSNSLLKQNLHLWLTVF